jgi:hypothetical protein
MFHFITTQSTTTTIAQTTAKLWYRRNQSEAKTISTEGRRDAGVGFWFWFLFLFLSLPSTSGAHYRHMTKEREYQGGVS